MERQDSPYALHYFVKQLSTIDDDGDWNAVENKYEVSLDADELRWGLREFGVEVELEECVWLLWPCSTLMVAGLYLPKN